MAQTRKKVRDAVKSIMSNATTGFNARLASIATAYGIAAFALDWAAGSKSVFYGYLNPGDVEIGQPAQDSTCPAALVIYTSDAEGQNLQKPTLFSGTITTHLDWYIRYRDGIEVDDIESICDAIEDASLECLYAPAAAWPSGVVLSAACVIPKEPAILTGEGWQQRIPMVFSCEVTA